MKGSKPLRLMTALMLATDVAFVFYWLMTGFHAVPDAWLYKDYKNPLMVDWNWSFLAIDLAVSTTGILAVIMLPRNTGMAFRLATISLTLTSASGLMALSFWTFRSDFDFFWWVPNGFLLVYPLPFLWRLVSSAKV